MKEKVNIDIFACHVLKNKHPYIYLHCQFIGETGKKKIYKHTPCLTCVYKPWRTFPDWIYPNESFPRLQPLKKSHTTKPSELFLAKFSILDGRHSSSSTTMSAIEMSAIGDERNEKRKIESNVRELFIPSSKQFDSTFIYLTYINDNIVLTICICAGHNKLILIHCRCAVAITILLWKKKELVPFLFCYFPVRAQLKWFGYDSRMKRKCIKNKIDE